MSEPVSALPGARAEGLVAVAEAGPVGMVTIRGDLGDAEFAEALETATGLAVPEARGLTAGAGRSLLWMSPDEVLLVCEHGEAAALTAAVSAALKGMHHLAIEVSDARAVFRLTGEGAAIREVLAKLTPADLRPGALPVGEVRRTRLSQVPAAFWFTGDGEATLVCFRSVAAYVFGLLETSAAPGSAVGHF